MGKRKWSTVLIVVPACWLHFRIVGCRNDSSKGEESLASGSTSGSSQGGSVTVRRDNPCSVLLPREVEEIVGLPVTMREASTRKPATSPSTNLQRVVQPRRSPPKISGGASAEGDAEAKAKSIRQGRRGETEPVRSRSMGGSGRPGHHSHAGWGGVLGSNDAGFEKLSGIGDQT